MSDYTSEQIISAKWHIRSLERTDIIPKEARIPPYEDSHGQDWALENEALIILAALEAAEKERDDAERARDDAYIYAKAYAAKLEKAGDTMRKSNKVACLYDWDAARKEKPGA
jgi:hypothetical protein